MSTRVPHTFENPPTEIAPQKYPNHEKILLYSFALYPNDSSASGHVNFSTVKEPILYGNLFNGGEYNRRFHILAKTMNFIRIREGVMSQVFDYTT